MTKRRLSLVAIIVLLSLIGAAASTHAFGLTSSEHAEPADAVIFGTLGTAALSIDLSGTEGDILERIVRRVQAPDLHAEVGEAPSGYRESVESTSAAAPNFIDGVWLYVTVDSPSATPNPLPHRQIWEAQLVAGALRDALHAAGKRPLYNVQIDVHLAGGKVLSNATSGLGNVSFNRRFENDSLESVRDRVLAVAPSLGLHVAKVELVEAENPAPAITMILDSDPAEIIEQRASLAAKLFGDPVRYEGYFLEIKDAVGEPVMVLTASLRAGVGMTWIRRDLDPRFPKDGRGPIGL